MQDIVQGTKRFPPRRFGYDDTIFFSIKVKSGTSPKVHISSCDPQVFGDYLGDHFFAYSTSRTGAENTVFRILTQRGIAIGIDFAVPRN